MTVATSSYDRLEERFRRLSALQEAAGMLHWDMATVMPDGGRSARAEQLATIEVICHETLTAPDTEDLLHAAEAKGDALNSWQRANLGEMRRTHTHATALDARSATTNGAGARSGATCNMRLPTRWSSTERKMKRPNGSRGVSVPVHCQRPLRYAKGCAREPPSSRRSTVTEPSAPSMACGRA